MFFVHNMCDPFVSRVLFECLHWIIWIIITYCLFSYQCSHLSFCIKIRAKPLTEEWRLEAHDSVRVNFIDFS